MNIQRMIALFMDYCRNKQLRPQTMVSYEKALKLFSLRLKEHYEIEIAEEVKESHMSSKPKPADGRSAPFSF